MKGKSVEETVELLKDEALYLKKDEKRSAIVMLISFTLIALFMVEYVMGAKAAVSIPDFILLGVCLMLGCSTLNRYSEDKERLRVILKELEIICYH